MYTDVNSKRVYADTGGKSFDNSKPTVIFMHGSGLDHTFWRGHSESFAAANYSVLALDLPGHTNSDGPPLTSVESMADWLNSVAEKTGADDISLIGHSQGCLVALEFASCFRKNIRSLSLVASGLATPVNAELIDAADNNPATAIAMMLKWSFNPAATTRSAPTSDDPMMATIQKAMRGNVPGALSTDLRACDSYRNGREAAAAISCPIQVILGGKDRMAPREAGMELVAHLDNPELHILAESGHMVPQEAPDETRQLLRDFVVSNNPSH